MAERFQSPQFLLPLCVVAMLGVMAVVHREDVRRERQAREAGEPVRELPLAEQPSAPANEIELATEVERPRIRISSDAAERELDPEELSSWERTRDRVDYLAEHREVAPIDDEPARCVADFIETRSPRRDPAWVDVPAEPECPSTTGELAVDVSIDTAEGSESRLDTARIGERHFTDYRYFGKDQMVLRDSAGVHLLDCSDVGAIAFEMRPGFTGRAGRNLILRRGTEFVDSDGRKHTRAELEELLAAVGRTRPVQAGLVRTPDVDWDCERTPRDDEYAVVWIPGSEWIVAGTDRAVERADAWYVRCGADSWCTRDPQACAALIGLFGAGPQR